MRDLKQTILAVSAAAATLTGSPASACNTEPYLGSVCIVAFTFCPRGYLEAAGQIMSIAQNTALFSLVGTTYGGDGQVTFALPDLRGRVPRGLGQGPGLGGVDQGDKAGLENVTLTSTQMPPHTHAAQMNATGSPGTADSPAGALPAKAASGLPYGSGGAAVTMSGSAVTIGVAGSGQPFTVLDPYLGLRFCIATEGIYPSRP